MVGAARVFPGVGILVSVYEKRNPFSLRDTAFLEISRTFLENFISKKFSTFEVLTL